MQTFLLLCLGIVTIFVMARMNKSNKLFWTLVLSMLAGFVGGAIATQAKTLKKTKLEVVCQNTTQIPMCYLQTIYDDTDKHCNIHMCAKSEDESSMYDFKPTCTYKIIANEYYQPSKPFDTS